MFPAGVGYLMQRSRLVLRFAGYKEGCHCYYEVVILLVGLAGEKAHQIHLRGGYADNALLKCLTCRMGAQEEREVQIIGLAGTVCQSLVFLS